MLIVDEVRKNPKRDAGPVMVMEENEKAVTELCLFLHVILCV